MANQVIHHHHHHRRTGFGIGALIAVILSWITNHSILWAIFHAFCGWIYVIFWMFVHYKG